MPAWIGSRQELQRLGALLMEHLSVEGKGNLPNVNLEIVDTNDETSEDDFTTLAEDYDFRYAKRMTLSGYANATDDYRRFTIDFNREIFSDGCSITVWGILPG
jgi:hypothetical protein